MISWSVIVGTIVTKAGFNLFLLNIKIDTSWWKVLVSSNSEWILPNLIEVVSGTKLSFVDEMSSKFIEESHVGTFLINFWQGEYTVSEWSTEIRWVISV